MRQAFEKYGCKSVGVQRQYSGTAGRIDNCQVGVFLSYASSRGHTLLDRELYVPKSWIDDQERGLEAHVPPEVTFATKQELARRMLERTLDAGEWERLARGLAREDWQVLSAGTGNKGPRLFAWARIERAAPEISGWQRWLLVRQSLDEGAKPPDRAYVLVFAPVGTTLQEMVEADRARAGRWSNVLKKAKEKWAWMSTRVRSQAGDGTAT